MIDWLFRPIEWMKQTTQPSVALFVTIALEWPLRLALLALALPFLMLKIFGDRCIAIDDERERRIAAGLVVEPQKNTRPKKNPNRPLTGSAVADIMMFDGRTDEIRAAKRIRNLLN